MFLGMTILRALRFFAFGLCLMDLAARDAAAQEQDLVSLNFPEPTEIRAITQAVARWTGKNVIIGKRVVGKVQIIAAEKVSRAEAYQIFLSALNVAGYTTVETGKTIKIVPLVTATRANPEVYGRSAPIPRTDRVVTQVMNLRYLEARAAQQTLMKIMKLTSLVAFRPSNSLIVTDTGFKIRRVQGILEILDVPKQRLKVVFIPLIYGDAKSVAGKLSEILKSIEPTRSKTVAAANGKTKTVLSAASFKVTSDERSNSIIVFGPPALGEKAREIVKAFDVPLNEENSMGVRVRFLSYASAKKVLATLSSLTSGLGAERRVPRKGRRIGWPRSASPGQISLAALGSQLKIVADEATNALLISGSRSAYEAINGIIRKLDKRKPQVYIEADILDIELGETGAQGTSFFTAEGDESTVAWRARALEPIFAAGSEPSSDSDRLAAADALGKDFSLAVLAGKSLDIPGLGPVTPAGLIQIAKADARTRVLSSPHLLTSNNESARIVVGDRIFYRSAAASTVPGAGAVEKVEKENADLRLEIKANASPSNGYVTMKVDLEANEGGLDPGSGIPNINKRRSKQVVTVKNGQTTVISGLLRRRRTESFQKIPLLGDIPFLSWFFRQQNTQASTSTLLIFVTPHIVLGANDLAAIYDRRLAEKKRLLASAFGSAASSIP